MVGMTPSTIMPPPTCDNYKAKKCILGHIWPHHDLDLLTPKSDVFILAPKIVSGESLVKFRQQIPKLSYLASNVYSGLTHARTDEHSGNIMSPASTLAEA